MPLEVWSIWNFLLRGGHRSAASPRPDDGVAPASEKQCHDTRSAHYDTQHLAGDDQARVPLPARHVLRCPRRLHRLHPPRLIDLRRAAGGHDKDAAAESPGVRQVADLAGEQRVAQPANERAGNRGRGVLRSSEAARGHARGGRGQQGHLRHDRALPEVRDAQPREIHACRPRQNGLEVGAEGGDAAPDEAEVGRDAEHHPVDLGLGRAAGGAHAREEDLVALSGLLQQRPRQRHAAVLVVEEGERGHVVPPEVAAVGVVDGAAGNAPLVVADLDRHGGGARHVQVLLLHDVTPVQGRLEAERGLLPQPLRLLEGGLHHEGGAAVRGWGCRRGVLC
mmetsp:Transcript_55255/g.173252  ORF Transcript_55255/g.173252 Transcript_55255/m.173252 type:complete len:336 (+) Transcript_55255:139-1146(+)